MAWNHARFLLPLIGSLAILTETKLVQTPQPPDRSLGIIAGRVLDAKGNPLEGARVYANITGRPPQGRTLYAITDSSGNFILDRVAPGMNMVHAFKESEGYPDTFFAFFVADSKSVPVVRVAPGKTIRGVVVRLEKKAGTLVGLIVDSRSSRPVTEAEVLIFRENNANISITTRPTTGDGRFSLLVPPLRMKMKVTANGYKEWRYQEAGKPPDGAIQVLPGATKQLTIRLEPSS